MHMLHTRLWHTAMIDLLSKLRSMHILAIIRTLTDSLEQNAKKFILLNGLFFVLSPEEYIIVIKSNKIHIIIWRFENLCEQQFIFCSRND